MSEICLFIKLYRVSENRNLDIFVVDWILERMSWFVVLDKIGKLKCVCRGRLRRFGEMLFNLSDVCCNFEFYVIVSDFIGYVV